MANDGDVCPCGFAAPYAEHCGRIHLDGAGLGATAEALMRARYSAYVLQDRSFLLASWHPDTRPTSIDFDDHIEWLDLEIVDTESGGALDSAGVVEFRARFSRSGEHLELHERSSFARAAGLWLYVSGT
jgi:SEC-C motif-containing protein